MSKAVIFITVDGFVSGENLEHFQKYVQEKLPEYVILFSSVKMKIDVVSSKEEAIRLFNITAEDVNKLLINDPNTTPPDIK